MAEIRDPVYVISDRDLDDAVPGAMSACRRCAGGDIRLVGALVFDAAWWRDRHDEPRLHDGVLVAADVTVVFPDGRMRRLLAARGAGAVTVTALGDAGRAHPDEQAAGRQQRADDRSAATA